MRGLRWRETWSKVRAGWVAAGCVIILGVAMSLGSHRSAPSAVPTSAAPAPETGHADLRLVYTGQLWHGKPVYQLTLIDGEPLRRIRVVSRSGSTLPILRQPGGDPAPAPHDLRAGESLWLVGPNLPPLSVIVMWTDDQGKARWETLQDVPP